MEYIIRGSLIFIFFIFTFILFKWLFKYVLNASRNRNVKFIIFISIVTLVVCFFGDKMMSSLFPVTYEQIKK